MKNINVGMDYAITIAQPRICSRQLLKGFKGATTGVLAQGPQLC